MTKDDKLTRGFTKIQGGQTPIFELTTYSADDEGNLTANGTARLALRSELLRGFPRDEDKVLEGFLITDVLGALIEALEESYSIDMKAASNKLKEARLWAREAERVAEEDNLRIDLRVAVRRSRLINRQS